MFGPMILFREAAYASKDGGAQQKFFSSNIPFMRTASKLMVALNVSEIAANTEVSLYLEGSFDGINWVAVETLTASAVTATGVTFYENTENVGPLTRIVLSVKHASAAATVQATCEVRVFGKMISV